MGKEQRAPTAAGEFYCERYQETMTRAQCLSWQQENDGAESAEELPHIGCDGCDQGDEIRAAEGERPAQANETKKMTPAAIAKARWHAANLGRKLGKMEEKMGESQEVVRMKDGATKTCVKGTCGNCKRPNVSIPKGMTTCHQCNKYLAGTRGNPDLRLQRMREARELYGALKPGEKLPSGAAKAKKATLAGGGDSSKMQLRKLPPVEELASETASDGAAAPSSPAGSLPEVEGKLKKSAEIKDNKETVRSDVRGLSDGWFESELSDTAVPHTVIPVTLRLTVEILVKVNGIQA